MNKKLLSTALLAVLLFFAGGQWADAASWRINNNANRHAHFTDINAAMSSNSGVSDGDTLYLDPGCLITSTQNVTKRVTIIGTGYFPQNNAHQQACINARINLKAAGSKLEGVAVSNGNDIYIQANNITIERCLFNNVYWSGTGQYANIRQCYGYRIYGSGPTNNNSANCTIENCIIMGDIDCIRDLYLATVKHNYLKVTNKNNMYCFYKLDSPVIIGNILINIYDANHILDTVTGIIDISHNVMSCASTTYGIPESNRFGATESAVFSLEGSNDQRYQLKADSPAKSAAADGGDCGPYGGRYPYIPSGYPFGMPRFESSVVGTRPQSGQVSVTQQVTIQKQ